jgi:hypothetical protein
MDFSKWKKFLKRSNCVSVEQLVSYMEAGFNDVTSEDWDGFYRYMKRGINKALDRLAF